MPTYRVYYAERRPYPGRDWKRIYGWPREGEEPEEARHAETEWEEEIEAPTLSAALDAFFRDHVSDNSQLMWVDEGGESRLVEGLDYDPDKTYIWIEGDKLMEYQGIDEATPGMVTCPLCGGEGEVEADLAEEFLAGNEESEGESSP